MNRALAISIAALPFATAFGLYATGALERIDNALGMRIDRLRFGVSKPNPGRAQPLEKYASWFYPLEVVRKKGNDVLWSVRLRPVDNPNSLLNLDERCARNPQKNPHDNQSSFTALRHVK